MSALLENLRRICGHANVLTHDDPQTDLSAWEQDWRKRSHGKALAVVRPANVQEVAAVVKACAKESVSIVPQETPSTGTPNPKKDKMTSALIQATVSKEN